MFASLCYAYYYLLFRECRIDMVLRDPATAAVWRTVVNDTICDISENSYYHWHRTCVEEIILEISKS
jgi:hypothetical protein